MGKKRFTFEDDWYGGNEYGTHDVFGRFIEYPYSPPIIRDMDTPLNTTPHYSDPSFGYESGYKPRTVFGAEEEGLHYDYSDRIWQWDYKKAEEATAAATASGAKIKTARWYTVYLSYFFGKPVEIKHIMAGVNASNGYSYAVFGYRFLETE